MPEKVDVHGVVAPGFGLGFERPATEFPGLGPDAFGHCGAAGALGFADPRSGLAYGYVRRRFACPGGTAPENARLVQALIDAARSAHAESRPAGR
ncbi:hypothetical protein GXW83_11895 [Streptacidiphilus sp. PB12-B1b]|uniref:hypothetical protein n=1 Tax=Streptacidiphilus sp. PB12-B1b TaxID=2705012 RepID=UPI0015FD2F50|nr:hypothetical protein GXW83_11895 [Streptacidiphilus sp. PB12-B1b]